MESDDKHCLAAFIHTCNFKSLTCMVQPERSRVSFWNITPMLCHVLCTRKSAFATSVSLPGSTMANESIIVILRRNPLYSHKPYVWPDLREWKSPTQLLSTDRELPVIGNLGLLSGQEFELLFLDNEPYPVKASVLLAAASKYHGVAVLRSNTRATVLAARCLLRFPLVQSIGE